MNGCVKCTMGCSACNEWSSYLNFTDYLSYQKPELRATQRSMYKINFGIKDNFYCSSCDVAGLQYLKTGQCTVCGSNCKTCIVNQASLFISCVECKFGSGVTDESGQLFTISADKLDCTACPKNCMNCFDRDEAQRLAFNPHFQVTGSYGTNAKTCSLCAAGSGMVLGGHELWGIGGTERERGGGWSWERGGGLEKELIISFVNFLKFSTHARYLKII